MRHMALRVLAVAVVVFGWAWQAAAQQAVRLEFRDGTVTLSARNAPIRAILAEWARLGGATIVNADRVVGPPVTLELTDVHESQALAVLLRSVSGYMSAPRPAGSTGPSLFDRIVILPSSAAPVNPPPAAGAVQRPGVPRPGFLARPPVPPDMPEVEQDNPEPMGEPEDTATIPPQRGTPNIVRPPIQLNEDSGASENAEQPNDDVPGVTATPSNPFGVPPGSSATPGTVTPLPRGQQPGPPRPR